MTETKGLSAKVMRLQAENVELRRKLKIAEQRLENPDICKHGVLACVECERRCEDCGDDGKIEVRHERRLCENCVWEHENDDECPECSPQEFQ